MGKFSLARQDFREVLEDKPDNDIALKQVIFLKKILIIFSQVERYKQL